MSEIHQESTYDVIIVGGGPAGCATALSLIRNKHDASLLLVDDADSTTFKVGESLPAEARRVLEYLSPRMACDLQHGVETGMHLQNSGNASAWQSCDIYESPSIANIWGMGWHLDRAAFDTALREVAQEVLKESGKGNLVYGRCVLVAKNGDEWVIDVDDLETANKTSYRAQWVIDATGRKASLARMIGARIVKSDDLLAFYAVFTNSGSVARDDDHRTLVEAVPSGWFYTSPLPGERRLVVYHTDGNDPSSKTVRTLDGFLDLMHLHAAYISGLISRLDYEVLQEPGVSYPRHTAAYSSHLEPPWDEEARWSAVGDAAMAFDPLSSQGMMTALRVGTVLGLELARRLSGSDSPRRSMAEVYEIIRKDYEDKKALNYGQVQRFDTAFWQARKSP